MAQRKPQQPAVQEKTLLEGMRAWVENNPVLAPIIFVCGIIAATLTFFQVLPKPLQDEITAHMPWAKPAAGNGWAYVGNLNEKNDTQWTSHAKVELVNQSPAADRQYPFRIGDKVRVTSRMPQVIMDFKYDGTKHVLSKPTKFKGIVKEDEDYTGRFYEPGSEYEVEDVDVKGDPGKDRVMWLRLDK